MQQHPAFYMSNNWALFILNCTLCFFEGQKVYKALFRSRPADRNELFQPGRMVKNKSPLVLVFLECFCTQWFFIISHLVIWIKKKLNCKLVDKFRTCLMAGLLLGGTLKKKETVFHPSELWLSGRNINECCFGIKNDVTHSRCIAQDYTRSYTVISFFSQFICLLYVLYSCFHNKFHAGICVWCGRRVCWEWYSHNPYQK